VHQPGSLFEFRRCGTSQCSEGSREGIGALLKLKGKFMKNNGLFFSLAAVLLVTSFGFAGSKVEMSIDVPFAFYAGDQLLTAGNYIVTVNSGSISAAPVITFKTKYGKKICELAAQVESAANSSDQLLQFNDYGDKHFLSGISIQKLHATVSMSEAERQIKSKTEKG
jgi:hypothetical protein